MKLNRDSVILRAYRLKQAYLDSTNLNPAVAYNHFLKHCAKNKISPDDIKAFTTQFEHNDKTYTCNGIIFTDYLTFEKYYLSLPFKGRCRHAWQVLKQSLISKFKQTPKSK